MIKKLLFIPLSFIFLLFLFGCSADKEKEILDFDKYKNINIESIEEIDVEWDVNKEYPERFVISDDDVIKNILDELCKKDMFILKEERNDSGHSGIILVDNDNNKTRISLAYITDGDNIYYYSNNNVYDLVYNEGIKQGVLN